MKEPLTKRRFADLDETTNPVNANAKKFDARFGEWTAVRHERRSRSSTRWTANFRPSPDRLQKRLESSKINDNIGNCSPSLHYSKTTSKNSQIPTRNN